MSVLGFFPFVAGAVRRASYEAQPVFEKSRFRELSLLRRHREILSDIVILAFAFWIRFGFGNEDGRI